MKIELQNWEVQRIKDIVGRVLDLYMYDSIEVSTSGGHAMSMSTKTFLESLERDLKNPNL